MTWSRQTYTIAITDEMPLRIRPARADDAPAIGAIGSRAFRHNISPLLFPSHMRSLAPHDEETPFRVARTLRRMREGKITYVVIDEDESDGQAEKAVGFAQWQGPQDTSAAAEDLDDGAAAEAEALVTLDREALAAMHESIEAQAVKVLGPQGYKNMWCKSCPISRLLNHGGS